MIPGDDNRGEWSESGPRRTSRSDNPFHRKGGGRFTDSNTRVRSVRDENVGNGRVLVFTRTRNN